MSDSLETVEGPDWLHDAINSLICGDNVTAPVAHGKSVVLVTPQSLHEALAEHLGPLLTDDSEYLIERLLCEIIADGRRVRGKAHDLTIEALGQPADKQRHPTVLHQIAEALIRPCANEYGRARAKELKAGRAADLAEQHKADAA